MAADSSLLAFSNPLATIEQLSNSASRLDGVPASLERSLRYNGCLLTQAAGILLRLPQPVIAQAIIMFTRFFVGPEGGSFLLHDIKETSAASLYLMARLSTTPQSRRRVLNVYKYLVTEHMPYLGSISVSDSNDKSSPPSYTLSKAEYRTQRQILLSTEKMILRQLSYVTRACVPHPLVLTYLQTLSSIGNISEEQQKALAARSIAILNSALLNPQLLYLTHQPNALAVAALYLAALEVGVKISGGEWWLIWDVGREELGFLVVSMRSLEGWLQEEGEQGDGCWSVDIVQAILRNRS